jgi:hypothetical protein
LLTAHREEGLVFNFGDALEQKNELGSSILPQKQDTATWYAETDTESERLLNADHRVAYQRYLDPDPAQSSLPNYGYGLSYNVKEYC